MKRDGDLVSSSFDSWIDEMAGSNFNDVKVWRSWNRLAGTVIIRS